MQTPSQWSLTGSPEGLPLISWFPEKERAIKTSHFPALFLALLIGLATFVYWPGLQGGFLFDDFHNLEGMGAYGGIHDGEAFRAFVFSGISGPTGRPLSLASFLLNDNTWPSQAAWFKPTNLAIHLLCALLLCWSSLLLLRNFDFDEGSAQWLAVFSSACWLLHPLMVSTTLYVVQRMAQLATLFAFAGITGYLYGRALLPTRPRAAYLYLSASLGLGTILAVFSKENGALLPLLLLVVEFCLPRSKPRPAPAWTAVFLLLPSLALFGYFATLIDFSPNVWPTRSFDQPQRLWSQARILWEYLQLLFIPQIEGRGLFQDSYVISKGWLSPWTTLPASVGLLALFCAGLWLRRRSPLAALAILFFFAGHLMESSVIGLELYFEHRNYLSAAFLFLPLGQGLAFLARRHKPSIAFLAAALILCLLAGFSWQRARLWQNSGDLVLYWAAMNPDSPRAHNAVASLWAVRGKAEKADAYLEEAIERLPESALLNLQLLLQKIYTLRATPSDFEQTARRLALQPFDTQAVLAMRRIVDKVTQPASPEFYRDEALKLLDTMDHNANFSKFPVYLQLSPYLRGRLYLAKSELEESCRHYQKAISLYAEVESLMNMVAEIGSAEAFDCAQTALDMTEKILQQQKDRGLRRPRKTYESEIKRIRGIIEEEKQKSWGNRLPQSP